MSGHMMKRAQAVLLACFLVLSLLAGCAASPSRQELDAPPVTVTPADSQDISQAISSFGLSLLQNTRREEDTSVLVSPLSVALALSMAANGADGDTLAQFETVLGGGASLEELNAACAWMMDFCQTLGGSTQASIANSLWADPDGMIREDFIGKCRGIFDAQVFQAELSDPAIVGSLNGWVSGHTNQLIPAIIEEPFDEGTAALLVNALYLKNTWAREFDPGNTRERPFIRMDGQAAAMDFLNAAATRYAYLQGEDAQGVILPYDDGKLGFFALMPDAGGEFAAWLDGLDGGALTALLLGAEDTLFYHLALPKFEAEWNGELKDILADMGLDAAFDPDRADFSLLGDNPAGYYISQVIHAAKIKVNEKGTEAAAATVAAVAGEGAPEDNGISLVFDHPFLYGIVDLGNGVPLFLGTFEEYPPEIMFY